MKGMQVFSYAGLSCYANTLPRYSLKHPQATSCFSSSFRRCAGPRMR